MYNFDESEYANNLLNDLMPKIRNGNCVNRAHTKYDDRSALMLASQLGLVDIIKELLEYKDIKVNVTTEFDKSALMLAAEYGQLESVKILLKCQDINTNQCTKHGWTALVFAADTGHIEIVKELLPHTDLQKCGQIALEYATLENYFEIVELLLKEFKQLQINKLRALKISRTSTDTNVKITNLLLQEVVNDFLFLEYYLPLDIIRKILMY